MIANLLGEPNPIEEEEKVVEEIKEDGLAEKPCGIMNPNQLSIIYHTRIELYYMQ